MKAASSTAKTRPLGPHSRVLARGAVGDGIDGRSREGRILRQTEAELVAQLGREPSFGERLLVRRIARGVPQLEIFDAKLSAGGEFTSHDARAFSALGNQVRLGLRDLGVKSSAAAKAKQAPPSLAEIAARHAKPPSAEQ